MLARIKKSRYTDSARDKKRAGIGVPMIHGGQPPSVRYFFVRDVSFMGRLYGVQQCTPVPCTRYANLYSLARPDWRQGRQVSETCTRRHIMSNSISKFDFQKKTVRTAVINDEINFCLADVCECLELTNPTVVSNQIKEEFELPKLNLGSFDTGFGIKDFTLITEPQLYFVMMRSRSALARAFRKWICEEVLPAIRKTGSYTQTINKIQQGELATLIAERFPDGKSRPYAWSRFNNHFRLASYKDLPAQKFEEACGYIKDMPLSKKVDAEIPKGKRAEEAIKEIVGYNRFLLSFDHNGYLAATLIDPDAFVMSIPQLIENITDSDFFTSDENLLSLINACTFKLNQRLQYNAKKVNQLSKRLAGVKK